MGRTLLHGSRRRTRPARCQTLGCHPEERVCCATKDLGASRERSRLLCGTYVCPVSSNRGPYSSDEIDFVAALVIPADTRYILPLAALHNSFDIWLPPTARTPAARSTKKPGIC